MPTRHSDYRFSVTIHTDELALVGCLRALSLYCQKTGNNKIPWGGTKDEDWECDDHEVTFRFSSPAYRDNMIKEAARLFSPDLWQEINRRDDDPAKRQRS